MAKFGITLRAGIPSPTNLTSTMSLVASTGRRDGAAHLCAPCVSSRWCCTAQRGAATIDLVMGYNRSNTSPMLKFLARLELVAAVARRTSSDL